jgi:hypothetical protein
MFTGHRVLSALVLLALLVGCGKDKPTEGDGSKPGEAPGGSASLTDGKAPDYKLTVEEMGEEIKKDRAGTEAKYAGKVLELSGVVEFPIVDDGNQSPIFTLKSTKPRTGLETTFSIDCVCDDRSLYGALGREQTVRVRGVYDKFGRLTPCAVLEKGPDTRVLVTAEQLAADFTANREEARKKYSDKTLVVTGTVTKIKPHGEGSTINRLELKGDGKLVVDVGYNKAHVADQYKVGDTVKVLTSRINAPGISGDNVVGLFMCYPLPK